MIRAEHLSKTFNAVGGKVQALRDINLDLPSGKFVSIVGKSGSGKSTLLALLGALDKPTSGKIMVGEQDVTRLGKHALNSYRGKTIGFVFQSYHLVPNLTALQNVMLPMEFARVSRTSRKARAVELLNSVGIEGGKQRRKPARLSGGEQQRVAIARALANQPKLILADEPTGNLDTQTGKMIFGLLHGLAKSQNTTIVAVTHDLELAGKTDISFSIRDGKLYKGNKL